MASGLLSLNIHTIIVRLCGCHSQFISLDIHILVVKVRGHHVSRSGVIIVQGQGSSW